MTDRWIFPDEAERLWRRAAELQAEAARGVDEGGRTGSGAAGNEGQEGEDGSPPEGYTLEHVRQAAVEAGIGDEFLARALAEMEAGGVPERRGTSDRLADLFLGQGPSALVITRTYDAPAEQVYAILQEILPSEPYPLRLVDTRGPHPLEGGVLRFEVPPVNYSRMGFSYEVRGWADIKEVRLSLERLGEDRTVVTMRAPLAHSRRVNLWVGGGISGTVSATVGAVVGGSLAAVLSSFQPSLTVLLAGLAAAGGTSTGLGWSLAHLWRPLYRYGLRRGRKALEAILLDMQVRLRPGTEVAPPGGAPPLPPAPPAASRRAGPSGSGASGTSGGAAAGG